MVFFLGFNLESNSQVRVEINSKASNEQTISIDGESSQALKSGG